MTVIANHRKAFSTQLWSYRTNRSGCLHWPGTDCLSQPDNFPYVFKPGQQGPEARCHRRPGRGRFVALGGSSLAALGLARTCQRVPSGDNETVINERHPGGSQKGRLRR
jgi:hypothetical protein